MSLDFYLINEEPIVKQSGTGVFVRKDGKNVELTKKEVLEIWPDAEFREVESFETKEVFHGNITHNLMLMASKVTSKHLNLYDVLWNPDKYNITQAIILAEYLYEAMKFMIINKEDLLQYNPENGWGDYETLLSFIEDIYRACKEYPNSTIEIDK